METQQKKKAAQRLNAVQPNHTIECETTGDGRLQNGQAQDNSQGRLFNGSEPPVTILKLGRQTKGRYTVVVPVDLLRDKRMIGLPAWIVCLALSMPRNWKLRSKWLCKEFGLDRRTVRAAMKRLVQTDYAKLKTVRVGQRFDRFWLIRALPKEQPWPDETAKAPMKTGPKKGISQGAISEPFRNVPISNTPTEYIPVSNDIGGREKSRSGNAEQKHESNGVAVSVSSLPLWVLKAKKKYPRAQDHPKWQEFADWCSTKRGYRGRPGSPIAKGFWTWLSHQTEPWRDRVKTRKDELARTPVWKLQKLRDEHVDEVNQLYRPVKDFHSRHMLSKEKRADIERRYKAHLPRRDELRGLIREIDEVIKERQKAKL